MLIAGISASPSGGTWPPSRLGLLLLAALAYFLLNRGDTDDTNDGTGTPTADSTVAAP
jgi:hypothetical protein